MSDAQIRIGKAELTDFVCRLFVAAGVDPVDATTVAEVLVWANLRGVDSHGIVRIPRYVELIGRGSINPRPNLRVESRVGAISVLEADRALGSVAMTEAMKEAISRARDVHIGWCAARNITHAGAIGYFALLAAAVGMAGIVLTASGPLMAYHGSKVSGVSTNPIAIAVPRNDGPPFLLDMSTSSVAHGKLLDAKGKGVPIPVGWGINAEGRDTTNPDEVVTLLPMAGPKGSGLSFMIEALCSLALANPRIAPSLSDPGSVADPLMNGVAMAIDLRAFGSVDQFMGDAAALGRSIAGLPLAAGVDRIFLPGERGNSIAAERERSGIPIPSVTWSRIVKMAASLQVALPA